MSKRKVQQAGRHQSRLKINALLGMALQHPEGDDRYWEAVAKLREYRSPEQLHWIAKASRSPNWRKRQLAINIACQLRQPGDANRQLAIAGLPQLAEQVLADGLRDRQWRVQASALYGLGHFPVAKCLPAMLSLVSHPEARIRHGLAFALGNYQEMPAAEALLHLMTDHDNEVRDWATFALGSLCELDSPRIRAGLLAAAADEDPEIRGEALVGLAQRRVAEAKPLVFAELDGDFHGSWAIDAAAILADRDFIQHLERLRAHPEIASDSYFSSVLEDAIQACSGEREAN